MVKLRNKKTRFLQKHFASLRAGMVNCYSNGFMDDNHFVHLLDEVYVALQNSCLRLAAMGIRALLELIMIDKCGDHGGFNKNLDAFEQQGFIAPVQRKTVQPVLEIGHAATHRSYKPQEKQLLLALDITESLIETLYVTEKKAEILKAPPRKKSK